MKEEPEILRNIAKEQWEKEVRESHIRNRMGYIVGEQWAKQREKEQKRYVLWQIYDKLKETN